MDKIMFIYKDYLIKAHCSKDNTYIENSYMIESIKDMKHIIKYIRKILNKEDYAVNKMSLFRQITEWRGHNMLYMFGYKKDRTKSVDLNINESWYKHVAYFILSIIYS